MWLLVSQSQLTNPARFDRPTATAIATLALHALQVEHKTMDTVALQAALDCCTLVIDVILEYPLQRLVFILH